MVRMVERGIVVGVGPDGVGAPLVDFVAAEASRRGAGVELLHVVHALVTMPESLERTQVADDSITRSGRAVLSSAASRLRRRVAAGVDIRTRIVTGPVAATIAARAESCELVVLERREAGRVPSFLSMSTSSRVAAHTEAPVVVVPRSWAGDADPGLPIATGVDRTRDAIGQVEPARAYATDCGRSLVVVHAVQPAEGGDSGTASADRQRQGWLSEADRELEECLAPLAGGVGAGIVREVRIADAVEALVEMTTRSAVLVLCRRMGEHQRGVYLGPVTRAVLREAQCPVMVVDRS